MNIAGSLTSVTVLGVTDLSTGTRISALSNDGGSAIVASPTKVTWITCTSTIKCSAIGSPVSVSLGPVIGIAVDIKRSTVWIAAASGLWKTTFTSGSSVVQETRVDHGCTAIEFDSK
jgi:hypothetical protein